MRALLYKDDIAQYLTEFQDLNNVVRLGGQVMKEMVARAVLEKLIELVYSRHGTVPLDDLCHGASCLQANDAEGRKTIDWGRKEGERRKGLTRANTVIYSNKGGSCLNRKANRVSSGQRPGIV